MSKAATDALVINATKRPNPADKPPPGYSSVGSNWDKFDPVELQSMLLTAVMNNLRTPEEWHYLGRHALPIFLPAFVAATYRLMFDIKPEGGDLDAPQGSFMGVCFMLLRKSLQHPPSSSTCHPQSCLSAPTSLPPPPTPRPHPSCVPCSGNTTAKFAANQNETCMPACYCGACALPVAASIDRVCCCMHVNSLGTLSGCNDQTVASLYNVMRKDALGVTQITCCFCR